VAMSSWLLAICRASRFARALLKRRRLSTAASWIAAGTTGALTASQRSALSSTVSWWATLSWCSVPKTASKGITCAHRRLKSTSTWLTSALALWRVWRPAL